MSERPMRIVIADQVCPHCGAAGVSKVLENGEDECGHWQYKCLTPSCDVGYFDNECGEWDERLTAEERAEMAKRVEAEVDAMMAGKTWVKTSPDDAPYERWELR